MATARTTKLENQSQSQLEVSVSTSNSVYSYTTSIIDFNDSFLKIELGVEESNNETRPCQAGLHSYVGADGDDDVVLRHRLCSDSDSAEESLDSRLEVGVTMAQP